MNVFRTNANYLKIFFFNLKNFNNTLKIFSSKVYYKSITKKQFKNIFITWGEKKNFEKNGNYNDNFFKISSQKKNDLFLIVNTLEEVPKNIGENIIIYSYSYKFLLSNYFKFLIYFFKNFYNPLKLIINFNWQNLFDTEFKNKLNSILENLDFKNCNFIYEGQNYQDGIVKFIKKKNKKIKTRAFISSIPSPYPINYYNYEKEFIDEINVYSYEQLALFKNYLNWQSKKVKVIKSKRFKKGFFKKTPHIYFPIDVINFDNILLNLDNFLISSKKIFCTPKIKFHPRFKSITKKFLYKTEIQKIIKKNKKKFSKSSKEIFSFFIGPTGALIEALENNVKVIQICDNNIFDNFNLKLWKNLRSKKLSEGVYSYKLKKKNGSLII